MKKLMLILCYCIAYLVLLLPTSSRAELVLSVQPYDGYEFNPFNYRDIVAGESFVVDVYSVNYFSSGLPQGANAFFDACGWDITIHYDSGIDYITSPLNLPTTTTYTIEPDRNVNARSLYYDQTVDASDPYWLSKIQNDGMGFYVEQAHYELLASFSFNTINPGAYYVGISNSDQTEGVWGIFYEGYPSGLSTYVKNVGFPYAYVNVVGSSTPASVPEPSTMLLLGTVLVGLVGFRKKLKM